MIRFRLLIEIYVEQATFNQPNIMAVSYTGAYLQRAGWQDTLQEEQKMLITIFYFLKGKYARSRKNILGFPNVSGVLSCQIGPPKFQAYCHGLGDSPGDIIC